MERFLYSQILNPLQKYDLPIDNYPVQISIHGILKEGRKEGRSHVRCLPPSLGSDRLAAAGGKIPMSEGRSGGSMIEGKQRLARARATATAAATGKCLEIV